MSFNTYNHHDTETFFIFTAFVPGLDPGLFIYVVSM